MVLFPHNSESIVSLSSSILIDDRILKPFSLASMHTTCFSSLEDFKIFISGVIKLHNDKLLSECFFSHCLRYLGFFNFLIYFWLCWVFNAGHRLSFCRDLGLLFIMVHRHLVAVASLGAELQL